MTRIVDQGPGMDRTGIALPQGRTLGGSTAINGMVCNRGQPEDCDEWASLGNPGWAVTDVLGCFRHCHHANICAATMMVAEKGVDMLLAGGR